MSANAVEAGAEKLPSPLDFSPTLAYLEPEWNGFRRIYKIAGPMFDETKHLIGASIKAEGSGYLLPGDYSICLVDSLIGKEIKGGFWVKEVPVVEAFHIIKTKKFSFMDTKELSLTDWFNKEAPKHVKEVEGERQLTSGWPWIYKGKSGTGSLVYEKGKEWGVSVAKSSNPVDAEGGILSNLTEEEALKGAKVWAASQYSYMRLYPIKNMLEGSEEIAKVVMKHCALLPSFKILGLRKVKAYVWGAYDGGNRNSKKAFNLLDGGIVEIDANGERTNRVAIVHPALWLGECWALVYSINGESNYKHFSCPMLFATHEQIKASVQKYRPDLKWGGFNLDLPYISFGGCERITILKDVVTCSIWNRPIDLRDWILGPGSSKMRIDRSKFGGAYTNPGGNDPHSRDDGSRVIKAVEFFKKEEAKKAKPPKPKKPAAKKALVSKPAAKKSREKVIAGGFVEVLPREVDDYDPFREED